MVQRSEAVFEDGLLRPLEPLCLQQKQHVLLTITDVPAAGRSSGWKAEQEWLSLHRKEYSGQWVALHGDVLLSNGSDARTVRDEARAKGVHLPLLVHIADDPDQPSAGWL